MTCFEAGVTGLPRDTPERKWVLGGGIEIPSTYKILEKNRPKKVSAQKKVKGLDNFFNTLKLSILYRNINKKALKKLLFFDSVVF